MSAIVKRKEAKLQTRRIETPVQADETYEDAGIDTAEPWYADFDALERARPVGSMLARSRPVPVLGQRVLATRPPSNHVSDVFWTPAWRGIRGGLKGVNLIYPST